MWAVYAWTVVKRWQQANKSRNRERVTMKEGGLGRVVA